MDEIQSTFHSYNHFFAFIFNYFDIFEKKYDFLAGSYLLIFYLDNTKKYLIYFLILITVSYFIKNTNVFKASLIYIVAILMTLDITAGVIRKGFREVSSLNYRLVILVLIMMNVEIVILKY